MVLATDESFNPDWGTTKDVISVSLRYTAATLVCSVKQHVTCPTTQFILVGLREGMGVVGDWLGNGVGDEEGIKVGESEGRVVGENVGR